jgi:hypothetical protein
VSDLRTNVTFESAPDELPDGWVSSRSHGMLAGSGEGVFWSTFPTIALPSCQVQVGPAP